ncbi:MAG: hypothetical protein FD174_2275 [Geobacteraceae bacterium]|nr:MAG: hypothetical protein FD174_2275 [Geobacteraceae bacterium]
MLLDADARRKSGFKDLISFMVLVLICVHPVNLRPMKGFKILLFSVSLWRMLNHTIFFLNFLIASASTTTPKTARKPASPARMSSPTSLR